MARAKKAADEAAVEETTTVETQAVETQEKKFPLSRLSANCLKLFKVPTSTFAGATANLQDGEYSKSEIAQIIEDWKRQEAK